VTLLLGRPISRGGFSEVVFSGELLDPRHKDRCNPGQDRRQWQWLNSTRKTQTKTVVLIRQRLKVRSRLLVFQWTEESKRSLASFNGWKLGRGSFWDIRFE
jgi:hypothetical protein